MPDVDSISTTERIGRMFAVVGVVGAIVQGGLIHRLVKRFGEAALLPPAFLLVAASLFWMPFAALGFPLLLDFGYLAMGQGVVSPALQSLVSRGVPADEQGEMMGSNQAMGALARVFGPLAGGLLFERVSFGAPFLMGGALMLVAAALSLIAGRRSTTHPVTS